MQWERPKAVFAKQALTAQGWQQDVLISIGTDGMIADVQKAKAPAGTPTFPLVLPGMSNVHSHAFQRAMAGLTEYTGGAGRDNFWSWREVMYDFLEKLTPEHIEGIARRFYIELLKGGYTAVGEFHYLHNDSSGKPYASHTELSDRVIAAAQTTGIHITHLPVMYETANFGGVPANDGQKRFVHTADSFIALLEALSKRYGKTDGVNLGVAPHSLRAVTPQTLEHILAALPKLDLAGCPVHIHAAEQVKEVEDSVAWSGKRPVQWLLDHCPVEKHWCLIHATHMTPEETEKLVASGATAGLCPTTEANLGDGIFPAELFLKAGGDFGVGSDSNVCTGPWEELRMMEYAQRLSQRRRAVLFGKSPSIGRTLYEKAAHGGAKALGLQGGAIAKGQRADLLALSIENTLLEGREGDVILDTLIFAEKPRITDVFVAGKRVIKDGHHKLDGA